MYSNLYTHIVVTAANSDEYLLQSNIANILTPKMVSKTVAMIMISVYCGLRMEETLELMCYLLSCFRIFLSFFFCCLA